jgi:hypothetical protein
MKTFGTPISEAWRATGLSQKNLVSKVEKEDGKSDLGVKNFLKPE